MAILLDRSVASSSMLSLYIYQTLHPFIFFTFCWNLGLERFCHPCQKNEAVQSLHLSLTLPLGSSSNFGEYSPPRTLKKKISFLALHYIKDFFITVVYYRPIIVLGFTVTCRSYLVRQVTNHLSMTGWATRKCTRQVIKTMIVLGKKGVCLPLLHPQEMKIWRWVAYRKVLVTTLSLQFNPSSVLMD